MCKHTDIATSLYGWGGFFLRGAAMGSGFFAFWWRCIDDKRKFSVDGLLSITFYSSVRSISFFVGSEHLREVQDKKGLYY